MIVRLRSLFSLKMAGLGFVFRRYGSAPNGWSDPTQVREHIEQAYRDCLALAAHNQVIQFGNERYPQQATQTPEIERTYREHPEALANVDPPVKLRAWGNQLGAVADFGERFEQALRHLQDVGLVGWEQLVSGKYVLRELHRRFPRLPGAGQFPLSHYLNEYLRACPDPPPDLLGLIERILEDAGR
jgi:hypothetical protein